MEAVANHEILTSEEVAALLRVSPRMVQIMASAGEIPAFRVGRFWRFRRDRIETLTRAETGEGQPLDTPKPTRPVDRDAPCDIEALYERLAAGTRSLAQRRRIRERLEAGHYPRNGYEEMLGSDMWTGRL